MKKKKTSYSALSQVLKRLRKNKLAMVGLFIILLLLVCVLFADVIAPYHYETMDTKAPYSPPTLKHLCGSQGRDDHKNR